MSDMIQLVRLEELYAVAVMPLMNLPIHSLPPSACVTRMVMIPTIVIPSFDAFSQIYSMLTKYSTRVASEYHLGDKILVKREDEFWSLYLLLEGEDVGIEALRVRSAALEEGVYPLSEVEKREERIASVLRNILMFRKYRLPVPVIHFFRVETQPLALIVARNINPMNLWDAHVTRLCCVEKPVLVSHDGIREYSGILFHTSTNVKVKPVSATDVSYGLKLGVYEVE